MLLKIGLFGILFLFNATPGFCHETSSTILCNAENITSIERSKQHKCKKYQNQLGYECLCKNADAWIEAPRTNKDNREPAFLRRMGSACLRDLEAAKNRIAKQGNQDESAGRFAAQFTKGLQHFNTNGLLTNEGVVNYKRLLKALKNETQQDFNEIVRSPECIRKFTNPQGAFTFSLEGTDSSLFSIEKFPKISSPEGAAELIEIYLMDLCRDVSFENYGNEKTQNAIKILQGLGGAYKGPRNSQGIIDESVLFRGSTYGNLIGPYVSQFLFLPLKFIPQTIFPAALGIQNLPQEIFIQSEQIYPIPSTRNFGITYENFIALQNGMIPEPYEYSDYDPNHKRYITDGRDLASYVHFDCPYQAYYNALTILFNAGCPFCKTSPYSNGTITNEDPFVSMGFFDVYSLMGSATAEAGKAAWAQKWRAHRVLRPEAYAGLVHNKKTLNLNPFNLDESFFKDYSGVNLLSLVYAKNAQQGAKTYLLGQAYPEGSPLHPSYPSGHATIAGACITIIKAFMNDTIKLKTLFKHLVKPDPSNPAVLIPLINEGEEEMTIASELDKLAFNIASGRNFAGVHYRIDAEEGIKLGEAVAIDLLKDHAIKFTEQTFAGFEITKIDGTRIRINAKGAYPL